MEHTYSLKLLEADANRRGNLFARLMQGLFAALGYENLRYEINKAGREIDIEAFHRIENRRVVAECKATKAKTGGDEINKFVGSLDVEKRSSDVETVGYFISLSGFTETAIQQERDVGGNRITLLNGDQVIQELINGRILVGQDSAEYKAGHCCAAQSGDLELEGTELLAHTMGLIWAVYFAHGKKRTHYTLVHADGTILDRSLAAEVEAADKATGGDLGLLSYLLSPSQSLSAESASCARKSYFEYLATECGEIQMEGLPADQEVGAHRLRLENIFVPLHLTKIVSDSQAPELEQDKQTQRRQRGDTPTNRLPIGEVLNKNSRIAVLAPPGGGKSTLLKRLAIAYAFPDRRALIHDSLPERDWLPLFIRCRQLDDLAKAPIRTVIQAIPKRAELNDRDSESFCQLIDHTLQNGSALLLVDGLDEISDEGSRLAFVNQLRTFLAVYPNVSVVITSREAGFRVVGGALSELCMHYKIADFDGDDIRRLTVAWHKEVVGDNPSVLAQSRDLCSAILRTERVRELAANPLLLTTLLLVNRWIGQLPNRRSALYEKALEVLLMTWNVQGHAPLDPDEAIPQLAFLAFSMMKQGQQRISTTRLFEILALAHRQMPDYLAFSKLSESEFIKRVESRSSVLISSGHEYEDGRIVRMYEFRHLTFQEFLAARAIVEGYYPDHKDGDTIVSILEPYLEDSEWAEVISLTAVLSGRRAHPLISQLIELTRQKNLGEEQDSPVAALLSQCILDEVKIPPEMLKNALYLIAESNPLSRSGQWLVLSILKTKYADLLVSIIKEAIVQPEVRLFRFANALSVIVNDQIGLNIFADLSDEQLESIHQLLTSEDPTDAAMGALAVLEVAFQFAQATKPKDRLPTNTLERFEPLRSLLDSQFLYVRFSAVWAYAWLLQRMSLEPSDTTELLQRFLGIWQTSHNPDATFAAAWAISELPLLRRSLRTHPKPTPELIGFLKHEHGVQDNADPRHLASLIIGYYCKAPWSDEELAELVAKEYTNLADTKDLCTRLLKRLGEPGLKHLAALRESNPKDQDS